MFKKIQIDYQCCVFQTLTKWSISRQWPKTRILKPHAYRNKQTTTIIEFAVAHVHVQLFITITAIMDHIWMPLNKSIHEHLYTLLTPCLAITDAHVVVVVVVVHDW